MFFHFALSCEAKRLNDKGWVKSELKISNWVKIKYGNKRKEKKIKQSLLEKAFLLVRKSTKMKEKI